MLRHTVRCRASAAAAKDMGAAVDTYDTIVIGGGVAGCLIASRVAAPQQRTLVVEAGPKPADGYKMPAAPWLYRADKNRYSQALGRPLNVASPGLKAGSLGLAEATLVEARVPRVLGGRSVALGSRTYVRGHKNDYADFPLPFDTVMQPLFKRLENIEKAGPHRGLHGRFDISRPSFYSPHHLPFLEELTRRQVPLVADFNRTGLFDNWGSGRPEVLVSGRTSEALSSLGHCLEPVLRNKRPVDVTLNAVVKSLVFAPSRRPGEEGKMVAADVNLRIAGEAEDRIVSANNVILCAGAIGNAQILRNSSRLPSTVRLAPAWAAPALTLQYPITTTDSLACLSNGVVKAFSFLEWRAAKRGWATSGFDDMSVFLSSTPPSANTYPNVRVDFQPFMFAGGALSSEHGLQCVVRLLRPSGRYNVTAQGELQEQSVFTSQEDIDAMHTAATFVDEVMRSTFRSIIVDAAKPTTRRSLELDGSFGGTVPLGAAVDPATMKLHGTSNVFIGDSSAVPRPLCADTIPLAMALGERVADSVLGKELPPPRQAAEQVTAAASS